jgi:hypothetical protein
MMLKKTGKIFVIVPFFIIAVFLVLASSQSNLIKIENITSAPGETNISVPVVLDNNESIAGFQFDVTYDNFLLFNDYEVTSRMPNASVVINNNSAGILKIAVLVPEEISPGNGPILNLIFDVNSSATSGDYPIDLTGVGLGSIVAQPVNSTSVNATFTIVSDSDGDGIDDDEDSCPLTYGCSEYEGCDYGHKEWLPPITNEENFTLQGGSTLPLKFNVTACNGSFVEDYGVKVKIYNNTLNFSKEYNATGSGDDYITIDMEEILYIVNVHTNELGMPLGEYIINVTYSNNLSSIIGFELVQMGIGRGKKLQ